MSQCPVCQTPVTADFGLVECEKCGAQLLVHMDGTVENSKPDDVVASDPEPPVGIIQENSDAEDTGHFSSETEAFVADFGRAEPALEPGDGGDLVSVPEGESGEDLFASEAPAEEALPDFLAEPVAETPAENLDIFDEPSNDATPDPEATVVYKPPGAVSDSPDLSDIAKFGNSDASGSRDGNLRYDVSISGVDTSDVRLALREALTDRKFLWDVDQILRGLKGGNVRIQNISPAKAHILITRLRSLPVKVRWEQYGTQQA